MKIGAIRAAIGMIGFGAVVLGFACLNKQDQNLNANANANSSILADDSCDEADVNQRVIKVKQKITDKIKNDPNLKKQFEGDPTQNPAIPPRFKFEVRKSPTSNHVEAIFEGGVSGKDKLKDLSDILNDFKKKGCLLRVVFVQTGTLPLAPDAVASGFEWLACEWPMQACPDGQCLPSCP